MTKPDSSPEDQANETTFAETLKRYKSQGFDLEADLDSLARKSAEEFSRKGLVYPLQGTVKEKWLCLRKLSEKPKEARELEDLIARIRNKTAHLKNALTQGLEAYRTALLSETQIDLDAQERRLADLELQKPELKRLVEAARKAIEEFRKTY